MSTMKGISILIVMVGLLLPMASLGFVRGYNPVLGFFGSLPRMRVVVVEEQRRTSIAAQIQGLRGKQYERVTVEEQNIPYSYVFALGCILVFLGTAGVLFNQQLSQAENEGQHSPLETPTENKSES